MILSLRDAKLGHADPNDRDCWPDYGDIPREDTHIEQETEPHINL